jgi:hypothetical protein
MEASVQAQHALPEPQRDAALIAILAAAIAAATPTPRPRAGFRPSLVSAAPGAGC